MKPRVLPCRGTKMKFEKKWQLASCSVGMLSRPSAVGDDADAGDRLPSSDGGDRMNSLTMGDSAPSEVAGELALLALLLLASDSTEPLRIPLLRERRSLDLELSMLLLLLSRKTSSKSSR